jgi:predicted TIM-barrel fold metal-dependent hydrolase
MTSSSVANLPLIDTDSHVSEPEDVWTSRMPSRFSDDMPQPVWVEEAGEKQWKVGSTLIEGVARHALAGFGKFPPEYPKSLDDVDPASYDAKARLQRLDEYGIYAQTLYPNIIAFSTQEFLRVGEDFALACVQAWNDFLAEWASVDPNRLIPLMMLPFWDIDASVCEIERAKDLGHKGIVLAGHMERGGFTPLWEPHWDPVFATAQDAGLSINFHVGFNMASAKDHQGLWKSTIEDICVLASTYMLGNAKAIADMVCRGVCHRFPELNFVSIESGVGWIPYLMENLDWWYKGHDAHNLIPDRELPSYYIRRQVYGTYWFEHDSARVTAELIPDNIMFETDFPHATSISPGPASYAEQPRKMAVDSLAGVEESVIRKVFYENAAKVYGLEIPDLTTA